MNEKAFGEDSMSAAQIKFCTDVESDSNFRRPSKDRKPENDECVQ